MLTGGWRKKDELIDDVFFGNKSEVLGNGLDSLLGLLQVLFVLVYLFVRLFFLLGYFRDHYLQV